MPIPIPIYQVDAFAERAFAGNPAAVCPLDAWLPDATLQAIAAENNLSETAFLVPRGDDWELRWFTPAVEVALCGHATLASAFVLLDVLGLDRPAVVFHTASGPLAVKRAGDALAMDFPALPARPAAAPAGLAAALGAEPAGVLVTDDRIMAVLDDAAAVEALAPDMAALCRLDRDMVIATAPGAGAVDCVSRVFVPKKGIDEDPVTGSAHCMLAPYWAGRLGRAEIRARQASARGGTLRCRVRGDRVELIGTAVLYMVGEIRL